MVRRKSPVRHNVKSHTREGKRIGSFTRGSGTKRVRNSRVVVDDTFPRKIELNQLALYIEQDFTLYDGTLYYTYIVKQIYNRGPRSPVSEPVEADFLFNEGNFTPSISGLKKARKYHQKQIDYLESSEGRYDRDESDVHQQWAHESAVEIANFLIPVLQKKQIKINRKGVISKT